MDTYFIDNFATPALDHRFLYTELIDAEDIEGLDSDEFDNVMGLAEEKLCDISYSTFCEEYPEINKKYYVDKLIPSKHISIQYDYPLISPVIMLYYSKFGFSANEIATIIQKQYQDFYANSKRYLPKNVRYYEDLCIRFYVDDEKSGVTYIRIGVDT